MRHQLRKFITVWKQSAVSFRKRTYRMLGVLAVLNAGVWLLTFLLGMRYPILYGLVAISYGLGLRHAVDADHIAAIDNTTRKLLQDKQKPVAVGFFFSLGHATVVLLLVMMLALFSSFVQTHLPEVRILGSLFGTLVSSAFLFLIGGINAVTLVDLLRRKQGILRGEAVSHEHHHVHGGLLTKLFKPVFATVTSSWRMYPVGFLFGLGFDTASEIALLSISATTGASGLPLLVVLLLPLAFMAAMALIDSLDGLLMLGAYGWAFVTPARKLTYNIVITVISVFVAFGIGMVEVLQIVLPKVLSSISLGNIGFGVICLFVILWIISYGFSLYKRKTIFHR